MLILPASRSQIRRATSAQIDQSDFEFADYCDWRFHSGAPSNEPNVLRGSNSAGTEPFLWNTIQAVPPSPDIMHVVSGADVPAGCPTDNCLRMTWRDPNEAKNLRLVINVPDYSPEWWHRFYAYVDGGWDQAGASMNHPHNVDVNETVPPLQHAMWSIHNNGVDSGEYAPDWTISPDCHSDGSMFRFCGPPGDICSLDAWYRFEFQHITLNSSGEPQMRVYPHIYNSAGTLIADADDYIMEHSPFPTLREWYDGGAYLIRKGGQTITAAQAGHRYIFGNEGPAFASGTTRYYYFAAVGAALEKIDDRLVA